MLGRLSELLNEHKAVRDFAFTGTVIVFGGLMVSHVLATGLQAGPPRLAALTDILAPKAEPDRAVSRQVIRSVLDDNITTGSISQKGASVVLDPCTGEQKLPLR